MNSEIFMYLLSALILLIGSISLFVQKVKKVEEETGEETIIELPFFGKLKTNYPAIAFVFIGAALAAFTFSKSYVVKDLWVVTGKFTAQESNIDWTKGRVDVLPEDFQTKIDRDGIYTVRGFIKSDLRFEKVIAQITYTNWKHHLTGRIRTTEGIENDSTENSSSVNHGEEIKIRNYKPVEVIKYHVDD